MGRRDRPLFVALVAVLAGCGCLAAGSSELISVLRATSSEDNAKILLEPHLADLPSLDLLVVEEVVSRGWWELARDLVARSHVQKVDLSVPVRKAGIKMKDEADELMRTLNPKYGEALQVSPAFQWAQNDTAIFLTVKFTARWNAPGALEVTEPSVVMNNNAFLFSGLGKHSNNKYKYALALSLFDHILPDFSVWSAASVGKLSVTMRKRWPRKWPRLLANKKTKIQNMHIWMDRQELLDGTLGGLQTSAHSPITCGLSEKLYCLAADACKSDCSQCTGRTVPDAEDNICTGIPTEKASISFTDSDMDLHEIGGEIKISKVKTDFDIQKFVVYYGTGEDAKLMTKDGDGVDRPSIVGETNPLGLTDMNLTIAPNTPFPEGATHLLVFSQNQHGEHPSPGSVLLVDAVLPKDKPKGLQFEDMDGELNEVRGTITIQRADDEANIVDYAVHWGRSATKKINSGSLVKEVYKGIAPKEGEDQKDPTHVVSSNTKIPDTALYLLVFAKNEHGENPNPVSLKLADNAKPCLVSDADQCPLGITVADYADLDAQKVQLSGTVQRGSNEEGVSSYVVYWGRKACDDGGSNSGTGVKINQIRDLPVGGSSDFSSHANTRRPSGASHVVVFAKNRYGESDNCVSVVLPDAKAKEEIRSGIYGVGEGDPKETGTKFTDAQGKEGVGGRDQEEQQEGGDPKTEL